VGSRGVEEACFLLAAGVVVYSYVGYPALVSLAAWLKPAPPVQRDAPTVDVSIVIVVHNEERVIEEKLLNCLGLDDPCQEILVISDGSTDGTERIVESFASKGVRLLALPGPQGKPNALNHGIPLCQGTIVVLTDARQRIASDAVRELVSNFHDHTIGAVSGELHLSAPIESGAPSGVGWYWNFEKLLRRMESRFDSTVGVTGALYALRKSLYRPIDPRLILDDVAIPMDVVTGGSRVIFEPLARAYDLIATRPRVEYERKVRTLAGNYQLLALRPSLLDPRRNRLWWQLVSHKVSRLVVPWCLLALLVASGLLAVEGGVFRALFWGQAAFYLLALLGALLAPFQIRLLSLPYAFVLLNLAAGHSLFRFLRGIDTAVWKKTAL
jgi:biofilm PGA synthesis N-glycosyltransferase PgaC